MKLFDICSRRFYQKDGVRRVIWYKAGFMKETDKGARYLRLFNQPETDLLVFEKEDTQGALIKEEAQEVKE